MKNLTITFLILFQSLWCYSQKEMDTPSIAEFKRLHGNTFNFPQENIDKIVDPINNTAFFYGETHTRNFEPIFKSDYIIYLNQKAGVHNIFMEFGYSAAAIFNEYLITGDTAFLQLDILYTTPFYMEMWKRLYIYNKTLPPNKKLRIYGVDFESPKTLYKALLMLKSQEAPIPNTLTEIFKNINTWATSESKQLNKSHSQNQKKIRVIFDKYKDDVARLYGPNTGIIYKMVKNNQFSMMDKSREKWMYANMQSELKENQIEKFVAFFGGDHVNYTNTTALPVKLRSVPQFKESISTIRMFCFNAVDNWSKETIECIGTYEIKECKKLSKTYLNDKRLRAVLVDNNTVEPFIKGTADAYIFAQDN